MPYSRRRSLYLLGLLATLALTVSRPSHAADTNRVTSVELGASLAQDGTYVTVRSLLKEGVAKLAGVRVGDRILSINGSPTSGLEQVETLFATRQTDKPISMVVERDSEEMLVIELRARPSKPKRVASKLLSIDNLTPYAMQQIEAATRATPETSSTPNAVRPAQHLIPTAIPEERALPPAIVTPTAPATSESSPVVSAQVGRNVQLHYPELIASEFVSQITYQAHVPIDEPRVQSYPPTAASPTQQEGIPQSLYRPTYAQPIRQIPTRSVTPSRGGFLQRIRNRRAAAARVR